MTEAFNGGPNPFDPGLTEAGPVLCRHCRSEEAPHHRASAQAQPSGLRAGTSRSGVQTDTGGHYRGEGRP